MNANELADEIEQAIADQEFATFASEKWHKDIADFIRQQQAEIEALKLQLHTTLTNRDLRTYDGKLDMNSEPVAWMRTNKQWRKEISWVEKEGFDIPLYTAEQLHPAKTLTDEEIEVLWEKHCPFDLTAGIDFANAVLKKAQQK